MERKIKFNGASWILSVALALYYHFFQKEIPELRENLVPVGEGHTRHLLNSPQKRHVEGEV